MGNNHSNNEEIVHIAIDGTLDLHAFKPQDIGSLVPEYLRECIKNNIFHVRIVHGKGKGKLRRGVHAILKKSEIVKTFTLGNESSGSWGATLVELKSDDNLS